MTVFGNYAFRQMVKGMWTLVILLMCASSLMGQEYNISVSGIVSDDKTKEALVFANAILRNAADSSFVQGTISDDRGLFVLTDIKPGDYLLELSFLGYTTRYMPLYIGPRTQYINLKTISLSENSQFLGEVTVTSEEEAISQQLDKKSYTLSENLSQSGGSVLQALSNLPGLTVNEGQLELRGSNQVIILIDGKQTAITGFGKQNGLDNIPASAIERIEVINNPSAKYDANGNAGIINIILKKESQDGWHGKLGLTGGLGALWVRKENLAGIRPQYQATPKINPSLALNYRREKLNFFVQADNLYTETLNKNEFVERAYADGSLVNQQLKRNRNTNFFTSKMGLDWFVDERNTFTLAAYFSQEAIKDYGDQPFFDGNTGSSLRLWQFLEDEVLTAAMASLNYEHKFIQPGHKLQVSFNYSFDREDEKYFFTNTRLDYSVEENFALIADQKVADFKLDYARPFQNGFLEAGFKFRQREIPTNMQFNPAAMHSVLDIGADGKATYQETIPALYGNYIYDLKHFQMELGLRLEYVDLQYNVQPGHNTYQSDGYDYLQPFPNARFTYRINEGNSLSLFYNRRVDRPDEVDIRIFPKYDDAEIIKVGNPALQPQFTQNVELGYKYAWEQGSIYGAAYRKMSNGLITRIASQSDTSNLIYAISQNAGNSSLSGLEMVFSQELNSRLKLNLNLNAYYNQIDAFRVQNLYPNPNTLLVAEQSQYSGFAKLNTTISFWKNAEAQISAVYLAPDIIPQGKIDARFTLDLGLRKTIQQGKGEIFLNATDLLNTMVIHREVQGASFSYTSSDYYETQVIRLGYSYKF